MENENIDEVEEFHKLEWDTKFFGVTCAKAILYKPLTEIEWNKMKEKFKTYQFISIENRNSDPTNAKLIGTDTTAFLADVNIQFKKKVQANFYMSKSVHIYEGMMRDQRVLKLDNFKFSKFVEDPEFIKRGGREIYREWLINSFEKSDKFYAISEDKRCQINGFLLHSYSGNTCIIELISVDGKFIRGGIGTDLFRAVEYECYQNGCSEIKVGTQVRNIEAINFYHKVGCTQVGCHQVYHLWNL
ncbi:GNAT family N-acetyltransferase [Clostridium sp. HBUAS56017]|uniref:GNAT family N-acetyltransferase n=1 Tax=Clostridium sp. HBUAS56017 TaxID=2571128 RepID=UPI001177FE66|nr:GNAT family N-acetyltransferase [Clostridium sp. HBUAS56017]